MRIRHRRRSRAVTAFSIFLAIVLASLVLPVTAADQFQMLVGSWSGENTESGKLAGKQFNRRRWLIVHRSDGSARDVQRYYLDNALQGEVIEDYKWGVKDGIYWNVCQVKSVDGAKRSCSNRTEYQIQSLTEREFKYKSVKSGAGFSAVRVAEDFRLP
jgi:hypothetical protein